jgi:hypothetical protein
VIIVLHCQFSCRLIANFLALISGETKTLEEEKMKNTLRVLILMIVASVGSFAQINSGAPVPAPMPGVPQPPAVQR